MKHFKTVSAIKKASLEELTKVVGTSKATIILERNGFGEGDSD